MDPTSGEISPLYSVVCMRACMRGDGLPRMNKLGEKGISCRVTDLSPKIWGFRTTPNHIGQCAHPSLTSLYNLCGER